MTLLFDIRNFFVREKGWSLLFVLILGIYAWSLLWHRKMPEEASSEMIQELRSAESKLKEKIREGGGIEEFLKSNPKLLLALNLFSFLLLGSVGMGLFVDFAWVTRPHWRNRVEALRGPPPAKPWGVGTIFKVLLLFISGALILGFLLALFRARFFPQVSLNLLPLIHTTISDLLCVGFVIYFIRRLGGNWRDLGFRGVEWLKDFAVGLAGYLAILPPFILVLILAAVLAYVFNYEPPPHPLVEIFLEEEKRSSGIVAYSIFLATVAGPLFEEIFFRGFCYPAFKKRWGKVRALVLSAAFFALIHQNTFAFFPIFVLGLGLGYLYEKRGTLVPSIALHVVHNSVFIAYFFLAKQVLVGR